MLFYLFNEIHLLKLTLTGNEIAVPRAPAEDSDEEEDEVAEDTSPSTSHYKTPSGRLALDPKEMLDTWG